MLPYIKRQLARDLPLQDRVRSEARAIFADVARDKRELKFEDLPRFKLLTKCIAETLRLWNVANVVFPRVTSFADKVTGIEQHQEHESEVDLPAGTKFTFCKSDINTGAVSFLFVSLSPFSSYTFFLLFLSFPFLSLFLSFSLSLSLSFSLALFPSRAFSFSRFPPPSLPKPHSYLLFPLPSVLSPL